MNDRKPEIKDIKQVYEGHYLKGYELDYSNKAGNDKVYEMVSLHHIEKADDIGCMLNGVAILALNDKNEMLLLKEFRMAVGRYVYNLCAGMSEKGESPEEAVKRELFEETGLEVTEFIDILNPCFEAVALADVKSSLAVVHVDGVITQKGEEENESIEAGFYSQAEVADLLANETFSSRSQIAAYLFSKGMMRF
ncbi:MAG: NUDIX hydrolase [Lachnospiraceae bacterium]|jgi:8-oxo-dGTP pyrophosphatase MutT (NUDIX family)|nr:NUDIX hydrolase [Lachnospiraceae bacterium]